MADLADGQYELVNGDERWLFGRDTSCLVDAVDFGSPQLTNHDTPHPRGDGTLFGRDYRGSRTVTITGNVLTDPGGALDALGGMEAAWLADGVRSEPSATSVLRMSRGGRLRTLYGRPRKFASTSRLSSRGWVPYTCDFTTLDHLYYGDDEAANLVPFVPNAVGGLIGGQVGGWAASSSGSSSGQVVVAGTRPSWLVWRVRGPIVNPQIEVVGRWIATLNTTVAYDQFISVDPSPWNRSVRRNDGANFSGAFTAASVRLSEMQVPPGANQVLLRGIDPTGSSSVELFWRNVWSSY